MSLFISIVSHEDTVEIIHDLQPHKFRSPDSQVVIVDNRPVAELEDYARQHSLNYVKNQTVKGFGANHNQAFYYCQSQLGMDTEKDWFIILNPDLECTPENLGLFIKDLEAAGGEIGAPNLFKDRDYREHEESVRRFPYLWELLTSYFFRKNRTGIDRHTDTACKVDWASGACLAFKAKTFEALKGFDERYFLYYEDVDICWRAQHILGQETWYIPSAKMVHRGKRSSHALNNRHLWWHLSSALRFAWVRTKTAIWGRKGLT